MVEAWRGGDRGRALEVAPTDLIEDIFVLGEPSEQRARLEAYRERGITTPVLLIIPPGGSASVDEYGAAVESLAPER